MSTVTDIARRRADRLRVMNAIYEAAEGSRMSHVSGGWLLEHLELSDEELGGICRYLEGEQLITAGREYWGHHTPFMILLTHAGIEEMKQSRQAPDQATEHFPPISMIHVEGDAIFARVAEHVVHADNAFEHQSGAWPPASHHCGCGETLWVPKTSSTSRGQAIFVDQTTDASVFRTRYWSRSAGSGSGFSGAAAASDR